MGLYGICQLTPGHDGEHSASVMFVERRENLPTLAEWETDNGVRVTVYDGPNSPESE